MLFKEFACYAKNANFDSNKHFSFKENGNVPVILQIYHMLRGTRRASLCVAQNVLPYVLRLQKLSEKPLWVSKNNLYALEKNTCTV